MPGENQESAGLARVRHRPYIGPTGHYLIPVRLKPQSTNLVGNETGQILLVRKDVVNEPLMDFRIWMLHRNELIIP